MILLLEIIVYALAAVGGLALLLLIGWIVCVTWKYLLRGSYNLFDRYGRSWVIITGATDGIGKEYA